MRFLTYCFTVGSLVITLLLTGCGGSNTAPGSSLNSTPSPSSPAASPTSTTAGPVTLHPDTLHYQVNDGIGITLRNQSSQTIYFPDHLTSCTVLLLQRQRVQPLASTGELSGVNPCLLKTATVLHSLGPGQHLAILIAPPRGGWVSGLYYAVLNYHLAGTPGSITSIQSPAFLVGSAIL